MDSVNGPKNHGRCGIGKYRYGLLRYRHIGNSGIGATLHLLQLYEGAPILSCNGRSDCSAIYTNHIVVAQLWLTSSLCQGLDDTCGIDLHLWAGTHMPSMVEQ